MPRWGGKAPSQPSGLGFLLERRKKPEATRLAGRARTVPLAAAATTLQCPQDPPGRSTVHPQTHASFKSPGSGQGRPPTFTTALEAETMKSRITLQLPPCLQTPLLGAVLPHLIPSPRIRRRRCFSCPAPAPPHRAQTSRPAGRFGLFPSPPPLPLTPPSVPFLLHRGHRVRAASARTPASPGAPAARPGRLAPLGRLETSRRPRPDPLPRPEVAPARRAAARGGGAPGEGPGTPALRPAGPPPSVCFHSRCAGACT